MIERLLSSRVWLHILFWLMISMIFYVFFSMFIYESFFVYLVNLIAILPSQILLSYLLIYYLIPKLFLKRKMLAFAVLFIIALYLSMVLARFLTIYVVEDINDRGYVKESVWEILSELRHLFNRYFLSVLIAPLIIIPIKVLKDHLEDRTKIVELEKEKVNAQLKFLKTQIHPHFLFNTLNNLYLLTLEQRPEAPDVVLKLSEMLDYMLYQGSEESVPLEKEIELLENYIALEKLRYDEDADITFNSSIEHRSSRIAPLMLLSLVENAFKHGGVNSEGRFSVNIEIRQKAGLFQMKVSNTKSSNVPMPHRKGIGLENIKSQLNLQYPGRHLIRIENLEMYYIVDLNIDLEE